jgi:DNA (cytosine-5)-methyltransferase 1
MKDKLLSAGVFSFFTGAGFLDLGFEKAGFAPLFANEISKDFCAVYKFSREKMGMVLPKYELAEKDVSLFLSEKTEKKVLTQYIKDARKNFDFIGFIGGPPCPDFSIAGKNVGQKGKHGKLSQIYIDMICKFNPDFFVFENVKGLWRTAKHRTFFDTITEQVKQAGYAVSYRLINALEYGAPQDRDRIILVGIKGTLISEKIDNDGMIENYPWNSYVTFPIEQIRNLKWPIRDKFVEDGSRKMPDEIIPELTVEYWFKKNNVQQHPNATHHFIPRSGLGKMKVFDEGDDSKKCYKRLHRWRYSPTVAYGNNEVHLHPYKARRLSVAEALSLQSLPMEFQLPSEIPLSSMFKTIGNGVPFLAAKGVAETLKSFLEDSCHAKL